MKKSPLFLFLLVIEISTISRGFCQGQAEEQTTKCKDESGNSIDWFIVYKFPILNNSAEEQFRAGAGYYFLTSKSSNSFTKSKRWINESISMILQTVQPLTRPEVARILYNDQPANLPSVVKDGHTKGLILADNLSGLWLSHSTPHFPTLTLSSRSGFSENENDHLNISYPIGGLINGQLFFCFSLDHGQLDNLGQVLKYTKPNLFNSSIPSNLQQFLPILSDFVANYSIIRSPPWFKQFSMDFSDKNFQIFAKGPKFRREIFADSIAPYYNTSMDVQSWQIGAHPFNSNCTTVKNKVFNIRSKKLNGLNFTEDVDHSKWGVGTGDQPLFCISDLNRMKPQKSRGGVAICLLDHNIWNSFRSIVDEIQACNMTRQVRKKSTQKKKYRNHYL